MGYARQHGRNRFAPFPGCVLSFSGDIGGPDSPDATGKIPTRLNLALPFEYRAFDEPWHAQLFALTVRLGEAGCFSWKEWTELFGAELELSKRGGKIDRSETYYRAWLRALEKLLVRLDCLSQDELDRVRARWERAYLSTPHGQPVKLNIDAA